MRSVAELAARLGKALRPVCVVLALALSASAFAQDVERQEITEREIAAALEVVRADPNLTAEQKVRTLRWVDQDSPKKPRKSPSWLEWFGELFKWLAQNGRYLFWGVFVVLAVMLIVYVARLAAGWRVAGPARVAQVPNFVRDLDIRPESLPDDIGAAARQLWDAGDHRAALSLLYRGLLSRLVHVHGVPIKDSTTEGDCLALANQHLFDERRKSYVRKLVRVWQRAVYGGERVSDESMHELCNEFARALNDPESAPPPGAQASTGFAS